MQGTSRPSRAICVTGGNLRNSHIYLREDLDFFPKDAIGQPNKADGQGVMITLRFPTLGDVVVSTDIPSDKFIFRERKTWGRFFTHHEFHEGQCVVFEKLSEYEYNVYPQMAAS